MIDLAQYNEEEPVSISSIAARQEISGTADVAP